MVSTELLIAIVVYSILGLLIYKNRNKFTIQGPFILRKTQMGIGLMKSLARFSWFWKIFGTIGIPVAIYWMFNLAFLLWGNAYDVVYNAGISGVAPMLPGIHVPGSPIFVPLFYGLISIGILAVVHEFAHGVVAAAEGVKIKSTGYGLLAVLPLFFVEPDEKQMMEIPPLSRLRITVAGALANLSVFLLVSLFMGMVFAPVLSMMIEYNGVSLVGVTEGTPAFNAGLRESMTVNAVDNNATLTKDSFVSTMAPYKPGDTVKIGTDTGDYFVKLESDAKNSSKAYMGIFLEQSTAPKESFGYFKFIVYSAEWVYGLLFWIAFLNLSIGVINFAPITFVDGGRVMMDLLGYVIKDKRLITYVFNAISFIFWGPLLFLLLMWFVRVLTSLHLGF